MGNTKSLYLKNPYPSNRQKYIPVFLISSKSISNESFIQTHVAPHNKVKMGEKDAWHPPGNFPKGVGREKLSNFPYSSSSMSDMIEGTICCLDSTHLKGKVHSRVSSGLGKQVRSYLHINDTRCPQLSHTSPWVTAIPSDRTFILSQLPAHPAVQFLIFVKHFSSRKENTFKP